MEIYFSWSFSFCLLLLLLVVCCSSTVAVLKYLLYSGVIKYVDVALKLLIIYFNAFTW
jgi:hypothetical protein